MATSLEGRQVVLQGCSCSDGLDSLCLFEADPDIVRLQPSHNYQTSSILTAVFLRLA